MVRKITCTAMVLALTAWLAVIPLGLPAASAESFKDTAGHWSGQAVEKAYALGLMTGYPGSVFKPEDPVSRLEAIAIVIRAMGLEEQARTVDYKNSGVALPQGMFWGQGHLVVAVKNGLLAKDSVYRLEYKGPITRYEVATLMSVALQDKFSVEGDVQKLTYADTKEIPADFQKYVANVTQNNIMQGLENNRFGPNETMKRGQMAALMARTVMDGWFAYGGVNIVRGNLETVENATGAVKIAGDSLRLVDSKTGLYKGSKKASLADFRVGDSVIGIAGSEPRFRYLEFTGEAGTPGIPVATPAETELTGKIVDRVLTGGSALKIRDSGYRDHLYALSTAVAITDGTGSRDLSYLADGQYVTVKVKDNIIQNVRMLASSETEGEIISINTGFLAIKTSSGDARPFTISSPDFKIASGSEQVPFSNLKIGDWVKVVSANGEAREIVRTGSSPVSPGIEAEVRTVDYFYWMITLLEDNGRRKEYEVKLGAPVTKGNDNVRLDELEQGDRVRFKLGVDGKITEISAVGRSVRSISGKVTELRAGSRPYIYVDSERYYIASSPDITRYGERIGLEDIMIGAGATLKLDKNDIVTEIDIDDENAIIEGAVTNISQGSSRITIEQSGGRDFTLRVNSNCTFRDLTSSSYSINELDDILEGWDVKLYLENGRVNSIRVTGR